MGSDIAQHAFPNLTDSDGALFFCRSILDPWPRYLQSSFDLVRQRLVTATCSPTQSVEVLQPGEWVQLMETDFQSNLPDDLPAGTRFRQMIPRSMSGLDLSPGQGSKLKGWLKELCMVQADEHVVDIGVGARSPDPSMKLDTIDDIMTVIEGMQKASKERGKCSFLFYISSESFADSEATCSNPGP